MLNWRPVWNTIHQDTRPLRAMGTHHWWLEHLRPGSSHHRTDPHRFRIRTGADAHSDTDGRITPAPNIFFNWASSSPANPKGVRLILCFTGRLVPVSIPCWIVLNFTKSNSLLASTSSNSHNNSLSCVCSYPFSSPLDFSMRLVKCLGISRFPFS